jgi:hypothetical protein
MEVRIFLTPVSHMDKQTNNIYQSKQTVFTINELAQWWGERDRGRFKARLAYQVKTGALIRLRRGVYATRATYDSREMATRFHVPSYIGFETVLRDAGAIFQHYDAIFVATRFSRTINVGTTRYVLRKLSDSILYNPAGILRDGPYSIATPERAFLDMLYLFPGFSVDNVRAIDWRICEELIDIYKNKRMRRELSDYMKKYAVE